MELYGTLLKESRTTSYSVITVIITSLDIVNTGKTISAFIKAGGM